MSTKVAGSLARIAGVVFIATALSKGMGFGRQLLIAKIYGSGEIYSSHNIAYIVPGFLLILLGGLNGPFHSATISVMKKREGQDNAALVETLSTLSAIVLGAVTLVLLLGADGIIYLLAPGASPETRQLAAEQLRIMAPLAVLAGQVGIGFGALNAAEHYLLPSLSPLLTNVAVIAALIAFGEKTNPAVLAWGVLVGALLQWGAQLWLQIKLGITQLRARLDWHRPEVKAVIALVIPAVISSGAIHINVYTDMFFASFVPNNRTISNLAYAQLLYLTPLGILSNALLVPLMPYYSSLAVPERWPELRQRVRQGLVATGLSILPFAMLLVVLARPAVKLVYERGEFSPDVTVEVASLLAAYAVGMLFYLGRDVLVRIFYALEDSRTPLKISVVAIVLNAVFDWIGIRLVGAPGLPLSTAGVNLAAVIWLGVALRKQIGVWPWKQTLWDLGRLTVLVAIAAVATWQVQSILDARWFSDRFSTLALKLSLSTAVGVVAYSAGALLLRLPEVDLVVARLRRLVLRR
ncbi:MAG: murein biosynthesis integral membrane protein MurJ [Cyanobacteria bacterium J06597_1]